MAERRKHRRYSRRLKVRFGEDGFTRVGFSSDISATGLFIVSSPVPKLGTRLHVEIVLDDDKSLFFEGVVQRQALIAPELRQMIKGGFGVEFLSSHQLLPELLPRLRAPPPKHDPGVVVLRYETSEQFRTAFDAELRRGGVFVKTAEQLSVKSTIKIAVELPYANR